MSLSFEFVTTISECGGVAIRFCFASQTISGADAPQAGVPLGSRWSLGIAILVGSGIAISRLRRETCFGGQGTPQIWRAGLQAAGGQDVLFAFRSILAEGHPSNL
jgi:hypothetical protein